MLNTLKVLSGRRPLVKLISKLCLVAVLAGYLLFTITAQATNRFSCSLGYNETSGNQVFVSCGSSAGNFIYTCDSNNNCQVDENSTSQGLGDSVCQSYQNQYGGCPDDDDY